MSWQGPNNEQPAWGGNAPDPYGPTVNAEDVNRWAPPVNQPPPQWGGNQNLLPPSMMPPMPPMPQQPQVPLPGQWGAQAPNPFGPTQEAQWQPPSGPNPPMPGWQ